MGSGLRRAVALGCVVLSACVLEGTGSWIAIAGALVTAIAAWSFRPASARAGGADTTTATDGTAGSSTDTSSGSADATSSSSGSTGDTSSTSTAESDDATSFDAETGPCLTVEPPLEPCLCACEVDGGDDAGMAALGLVPLLVARRRTRRELIERFQAEARLPPDVLARLRRDDEEHD